MAFWTLGVGDRQARALGKGAIAAAHGSVSKAPA